MVVIRILSFLLIVLSAQKCCGYWFGHDRAVEAAQQGNWSKAREYLNKTLSNTPHDPTLLYDAGVAEYKLGNFKQAHDYFKRVQSSDAAPLLKEKAYFNDGNTRASLKEFKEAVDAYRHALEIDPQDERATHNLAKAQALLKQEEQKNEQEKKEEQDKKQDEKGEQDSKDKDNKSSQDKQQDQGDDKGQQEQDGQDSGQKKGSKSQNSKQQQQDGSDDEQAGQDEGNQESKEGGEGKKGKQGQQEPEGQEHEGSPLKEEQQKSSQQQDTDSGTQEQALQAIPEQEGKENVNASKQEAKKVDEKLAVIMQEQEKRDSKRIKGFIKGVVEKRLAGQDGQHNR